MSPILLLLIAATDKPMGQQIVQHARGQIGVTISYDPAYRKLRYPGGDVAQSTGVCTDVLVRALRPLGVDLQKEVHEDMKANFSAYPRKWGLKRPDPNIDHRRVANLMTFFTRKHQSFKVTSKPVARTLPGDFVAWNLGSGLLHIGIVSDRQHEGTPLIIHNIGAGAKEEDILHEFKVIGHYRLMVDKHHLNGRTR